MNAISVLTEQHRKLEGLLKSGLGAERPDARSSCLSQIGDDLIKHVLSEEQVFYPAIKAKGTEDILLESLEEHLSLKRLLADLLTLDTADETWEAKLKVLSEQTEHHHKEEEEHLFPKVSKTHEADELATLAQKILAFQEQVKNNGAPREAVLEQTDMAAPLK